MLKDSSQDLSISLAITCTPNAFREFPFTAFWVRQYCAGLSCAGAVTSPVPQPPGTPHRCDHSTCLHMSIPPCPTAKNDSRHTRQDLSELNLKIWPWARGWDNLVTLGKLFKFPKPQFSSRIIRLVLQIPQDCGEEPLISRVLQNN